MANDISLTASMRSNLSSLQQTSSLIDSTQNKLSTGKKVNSALDNATNFFVAAAHNKRAADLTGRKDAMGEAIQSIKQADASVSGIKSLLEAAGGLVNSSYSATATDRSALATQFSAIMTQIDKLVSDSSYKGTNFMQKNSLTVSFNETGTSTLTVVGFSADFSSLGLSAMTNMTATGTVSASSATTSLDAASSQITVAIQTLSTNSSVLASNLSIINSRLDFTNSVINVEKEGADKLTLADMNEESANMLALQTRQNLGITSLSLASQAAQSILRLF